MSRRFRDVGDLRNHIARETAIHRQQSRPPILWEHGLELADHVGTALHICRIVEDGIAEEDNVFHGIHGSKTPLRFRRMSSAWCAVRQTMATKGHKEARKGMRVIGDV